MSNEITSIRALQIPIPANPCPSPGNDCQDEVIYFLLADIGGRDGLKEEYLDRIDLQAAFEIGNTKQVLRDVAWGLETPRVTWADSRKCLRREKAENVEAGSNRSSIITTISPAKKWAFPSLRLRSIKSSPRLRSSSLHVRFPVVTTLPSGTFRGLSFRRRRGADILVDINLNLNGSSISVIANTAERATVAGAAFT
jgi:hypothetical protein